MNNRKVLKFVEKREQPGGAFLLEDGLYKNTNLYCPTSAWISPIEGWELEQVHSRGIENRVDD